MQRVGAIALNTFREAVRDRVLYNLIVFALLLMGTAILFGQISIGVQKLILVNLGLTAMTFFGLAIAIFIGIGLVYKEMDKRTLYALLSKPVRRYEFILGKFCGLALTLLVNILLMSVGFFLALYYVKRGFDAADLPLFSAIYFIFLQLLLATALALLFSCFSSPVLSAAFTLGLFITGSFAADLRELSEALEAPWLEGLMQAVYYAVPNFSNFNVITSAAHGRAVPGALLWGNTAYGALYIGIVLLASMLIFHNRNLK
ncbi:MAG TPA: ABC transporter permease subunit [Candidatus Acidoferrales bacterium]|nr:ABC transporter permease subunit [Candidatus Acidoferrales bacterium]